VLYVETPASYVHLRQFTRNRVWYRWMLGVRQENPNLRVYTPPPSLPWKTRWHWSNRLTQSYVAPLLRRVIKAAGMQDPILLTFLPHHCDLVDHLPHKLVCYYCIDEWTALSRFVHPSTIQSYEDRLAARADLVFASSRSLETKLRSRNPETYLVPNGTDFELYHRALNPALALPTDIAPIPRPILGFSGLFDFRINQSLLEELARARPDWSLVFVGPVSVNAHRLRGFRNVHFLGRKPVRDLPAYFKAFDVALIPYSLNRMTLSIYPTKLNEYLAAGLPVVATNLPELANLGPIVSVVDNSAGFIQQVEQGLAERDDGARDARVEFARKNTWEKRAEAIWSAIVRKLNERGATVASTSPV